MFLKTLSLLASALVLSISFANDNEAIKADLYRMTIKGHKPLGYEEAKKQLFGNLHLKEDSIGFYVEDAYCRKIYRRNMGPGALPDQNVLNCEHTWPQSKFTSRFPEKAQKSDLHHLFPTDSKANSTRGNFDFAEVESNIHLKDCDASQSGESVTHKGDHNFFEPPAEHKGNVARALFYFSIRYKIEIDATQEKFLRQWHAQDPVDNDEISRNDAIALLQGNRNPFIDHPEYVDAVTNF